MSNDNSPGADIWQGFQTQFASGVGAVVLSATFVEVTVGTLYATLLHSPVAAMVAYGQPFRASVDGCRAVLKHMPDTPGRTEALGALDEAIKLYDRRNRVAHGAWFEQRGDDDSQRVVRFGRWGTRDRSQWTVADLFKLADELIAVATRVQDSVAGVADAAVTLPDELQP
jgi:hypothetical protein